MYRGVLWFNLCPSLSMSPFQFPRRQVLQAITAALLGGAQSARAQGDRTLRKLLVGFPPGGTADSLARALASQSQDPGSVYVIDNKSGAAGQLAVQATVQSVADGSSLLLTPSSVLTLAPLLYKTPLFHAQRDLQPLACLGDHCFALAVNGASNVNSLQAFVQWAKAHPAQATYATPGLGSAPHFLGVQMARETGLTLTHVPYRGVAPGLQDLMAGQVASTFNPLPTLLDLHRSGRIRILAVTSPRRLPTLPDTPTFTESGIAALQLVEWYGLFAPARTPAGVLGPLGQDIRNTLRSPGMLEAAKRMEINLRHEDAATLGKMVLQDQERWKGLVASSGIQLD